MAYSYQGYNNNLYRNRDPQSYHELEQYLSKGRSKDNRPIANNTRVIRRSPTAIAIKLHVTDVITFFENGSIQLNSNGWKTVTTKDRMTRFLPVGISVYSNKFIWYIRFNKKIYLYDDGMILCHDGYVTDSNGNHIPEHSNEVEKKKRSQLRKIDKFIRNGLKQLEAGKIKPDTSDCIICQCNKTSDDQLVEKFTCIQSHVDEGYFHWSLLMNAVKSECYDPTGMFGNPNMTYGLAQCDKHNLSCWANPEHPNAKPWVADLTIRRLKKVLKQFITKQLGI